MERLRRRLDDIGRAGRHATNPAAAPITPARAISQLCDLVGGRELRQAGVPLWEITTTFTDCCHRHSLAMPRRLAEVMAPTLLPTPDLRAPCDPRRTIVVDIETGGFAGTEVFLIGVVLLDEWPLRVVQWLARDYPEEAGILRAMAALARRYDTWVTFNGKSFDEPFLRDRAAVHRVTLPQPAEHIDLLHHARRRWRSGLPNCKLQTLEQYLLGWQRVGDVPSCDIPDLFHHFIRTGNAAPVRPILEHNQLDLTSCTELLLRLK
jgi:uncharacterized protein YprB with RNaseH-like and TPR domain